VTKLYTRIQRQRKRPTTVSKGNPKIKGEKRQEIMRLYDHGEKSESGTPQQRLQKEKVGRNQHPHSPNRKITKGT